MMKTSILHRDVTTLKAGRLTVVGTSVSGAYTTITIPELKICFDIGILIGEALACHTVFISHGHIDHYTAYLQHYRGRQIRKMGPAPCYIVPESMVAQLKKLSDMQYSLEHDKEGLEAPIQITSIDHSPLDLGKRGLKVVAYPMTHTVPSMAYAVIRETKKLRDEYLSYSGAEIGLLRKEGRDIFRTESIVEIAYTGDTTIEGVLKTPALLDAKVLIMECTLIKLSEGDDAKAWGHIGIKDITNNWRQFHNEHIILCHISPRYSGSVHETLERSLSEANIPSDFRRRIQVLWPDDDE